MVLIILLIAGIFLFEGYFLYTKKRWKELIIVSVILFLSLYFTLAENDILPRIEIIETLDTLLKPLSDIIEEF
jgi:hypothetical protein